MWWKGGRESSAGASAFYRRRIKVRTSSSVQARGAHVGLAQSGPQRRWYDRNAPSTWDHDCSKKRPDLCGPLARDGA